MKSFFEFFSVYKMKCDNLEHREGLSLHITVKKSMNFLSNIVSNLFEMFNICIK